VTALGERRGVDVNAWFDRVPRTTFDVGFRRVPAFRSLGILGYHLALLTAIFAGLVNGTPLVTTLGLSATAALSLFVWGVLRRAVTGRETLVLLEYVWFAMVCVAGFLWLSDVALRGTLDVFAVAVCPFLACGRIGCTLVGCCHGVPGPIGPRYGPDHHLPARLVGRRLLPVPLLEAVALAVIGAVGFALLREAPGTATVWLLAAYAVVRFGLERLRGDRRPTVAGLPIAKAMCVVQLGGAVALAEAWLVAGPPDRTTWVGLGGLGVALLAGLAVGGDGPLTSSLHLQRTWDTVVELAERARDEGEPLTARTELGLTVAVSDAGRGRFHVSLSHPEHSALGVGLALAEGPVERNGITHLRLALGPEPAPAPAPDLLPELAPEPAADPTSYFERPARSG
jgi:hypothetical protein